MLCTLNHAALRQLHAMSSREEDRFRPNIGPPRSRGSGRSHVARQVLVKVSRVGVTPPAGLPKPPSRKRARLGRGQAAAKFAGQSLNGRARCVVIKSRFVFFEGRGWRSTEDHEDYIERDGVD